MQVGGKKRRSTNELRIKMHVKTCKNYTKDLPTCEWGAKRSHYQLKKMLFE